jgi:hypothetical protein
MAAVVINCMGSVAILVWLFRRGRARNVLLCVAAVYLFSTFGPLVNLLLDEPTYQGIVVDQVARASTGFLLALIGFLLADLVLRQRDSFDVERPRTRTYDLVPFVFLVLACYALAVLLSKGTLMVGASKLERVGLAGQWHYQYLLLEIFAMALYGLARRTRFTHTVFWVNAGLYVAYCLVTSERDFIFVGFALLIQWQLLSRGARSGRLILAGIAGVVLASVLATLRENLEFSVTQTLNMGSIPFVDTFVMALVEGGEPLRHGSTYLDAVVGMLPTRSPDQVPLDQWLVSLYAPGSSGGYGFSLSGEAYLNFGLVGIPVVFFLVGLGLRAVVNRCDRSDFSAYLTVVVFFAVLSALRGDSAQLLTTVAYGVLFFALVHTVSSRVENDEGEADPGPPGPGNRPARVDGRRRSPDRVPDCAGASPRARLPEGDQ